MSLMTADFCKEGARRDSCRELMFENYDDIDIVHNTALETQSHGRSLPVETGLGLARLCFKVP